MAIDEAVHDAIQRSDDADREQPDIVIIGGGLVGALLSLSLQKEDYRVHVYERWADIRKANTMGKSINLVMTRRGLIAAERLNIKQDLIAIGKPVYGRRLHLLGETETRYQAYGMTDECNYSVSRLELNQVLVSKAEHAGTKFFFSHALDKVDVSGDLTVIRFADGKTVTLPADCPVIGADGGPSRVRKSLAESGLISYTEDILSQMYKEVSFLPDPETDAYCMDEKSLHIWPRTKHFLMGLADPTNTFTGTIYIDKKDWPETVEEAKIFLEKYYSSAIPMCGGLDAMAHALVNNSPGILGTVRTNKWFVGGKVCLIGDAAHAIVPFFGQGCNCGFEDVATFMECTSKSKPTSRAQFEHVFETFQILRKENAEAIADMALENFVEMREKVADEKFLLHKKIENKIEKTLPHLFRSRYAMVCYGGTGGITYSAAKKLGSVQYDFIQDLLSQYVDEEEDLDMESIEKLLLERIIPAQKEVGVNLEYMLN